MGDLPSDSTRVGSPPGDPGYPLLLVDEIVEVERARSAVGLKNVCANEPFFAGHFPDRPVMPGVLICEALAQVGGVLVRASSGGGSPALTGLDRVRFRRPVVPGDQLRLEVTALAHEGGTWRMRGTALVEGVVVAEADFGVAEGAGGGELPRELRAQIHSTAVVSSGAELDRSVRVGPYATIGPHVQIGAGTVVGPHAVVEGRTTLGANNKVFQFASVGAIPQDLKYHGEPSRLTIGDDNTIREFTSISPGTEGGGMVTRIGSGNLLMVNSHVAHDCVVGGQNILANGASLGGHVVIEDHAIVGGLAGVHQFARVGQSAILGAGTMVSLDVPPFCNATGDRAKLHGLNAVGLKRRGFSQEKIRGLKRAYHVLFQSRLRMKEAIRRTREELGALPEVEYLVAFIESSQRGVCR